MKTIILLIGAQGALKSSFLKQLKIPEFSVGDFKSKNDFDDKPDLLGITTNDFNLESLDKLNASCDLYGGANLLIFKLPSNRQGNMDFYHRLGVFIKTNFKLCDNPNNNSRFKKLIWPY